jgi:uncharacterized protein YodC (DUF2158 family)
MSKETNISIIPVGTKVKLHEDIFGTINRVIIAYDNSVFYEICWWNGRTRITEVFHSTEIEKTEEVRVKIGFHK